MVTEAAAASAIVLLAFGGLASANLLYDRGVPRSLSRYFPALIGGLAFLIAVLWLDAWTAVALSAVLTIFILVLRFGLRRGLRGVEGSLPGQAWAELTYGVAGTLSLVIGWALLGDRWLAFVPIAFMAWGDSVAGLTRATVWRGNESSLGPSIAMLGVCLAVAVLFTPYWIAALGAVVAPVAERKRPARPAFWDDNLNVVAVSLAVMAVIAEIAV